MIFYDCLIASAAKGKVDCRSCVFVTLCISVGVESDSYTDCNMDVIFSDSDIAYIFKNREFAALGYVQIFFSEYEKISVFLYFTVYCIKVL